MRAVELIRKGVLTLTTDGLAVTARMAATKLHRRLVPSPLRKATFRRDLERILNRYRDRPAIILPPLVDWDMPPFSRPQHIARALAGQGFLYFYGLPGARDGIHGFREIGDGLVLTDQYELVSGMPRRKVWHLYSTDLVHDLPGLKARMDANDVVVYEYIDELDGRIAKREIPAFVRERHARLLADERVCVLTSADQLRDEVLTVRRHNHLLVTNGVDLHHFSVRRGDTAVPRKLAPIVARKRPIVGYFGALASWFDYELVRELAVRRPDLEVVLIGWCYDGSSARFDWTSLPNVHRLGIVPYAQLPLHACWFDVAMIPFLVNDITRSTSPIKLFEYMALGVPVVTTDMRECRKYASVMIGRDHEEFIAAIDKALAARDDAAYRLKLAQEAGENSWDSKGQQVATMIRAALMPEVPAGHGGL